jgi:hypothetical protein
MRKSLDGHDTSIALDPDSCRWIGPISAASTCHCSLMSLNFSFGPKLSIWRTARIRTTTDVFYNSQGALIGGAALITATATKSSSFYAYPGE